MKCGRSGVRFVVVARHTDPVDQANMICFSIVQVQTCVLHLQVVLWRLHARRTRTSHNTRQCHISIPSIGPSPLTSGPPKRCGAPLLMMKHSHVTSWRHLLFTDIPRHVDAHDAKISAPQDPHATLTQDSPCQRCNLGWTHHPAPSPRT